MLPSAVDPVTLVAHVVYDVHDVVVLAAVGTDPELAEAAAAPPPPPWLPAVRDSAAGAENDVADFGRHSHAMAGWEIGIALVPVTAAGFGNWSTRECRAVVQ